MKLSTLVALALTVALCGVAPLQAQEKPPEAVPEKAQEAALEKAQEAVPEADQHAGWFADFDKAAETAKKEEKDLLIDFTGSDWCSWCIKLKEEVFDHEEFTKAMSPHFVLVALDFPRGEEAKAKVPNPERNKELSERHGVQGFPTVLLMTSDGAVYGKTGYKEGGPAKYIEHLNDMRANDRVRYFEVVDLLKKFEAATEEEKSDLLAKATESLAGMEAGSPGVEGLAAIVRTGLDAEDASIKEAAMLALLKSDQGDETIVTAARELDPKNEKGMLELAVKSGMSAIESEEDLKRAVESIEGLLALGPLKDADLQNIMLANMAFWNHRFLKDAEKAKKYAADLKKVAGDDPRFAQLFKMILEE